MRVWGLAIAIWCIATCAMAQDEPRVSVEVPETDTLVGQPVIVRITLLVPSWFPKPPDFPSFDMPGLMVRLPERASRPVSERIGAETWSGVQRTYRIYPMQFGRFDISNQSVRITYANPGQVDPIVADIALPDITINAVVPTAARNLDPVIIARNFELDGTVEGDEDLSVGGAVVRAVTARIDGTTPILLPQLTPATPETVFRSYPKEPEITETQNGDHLSGTRREVTTYLAQSEGMSALPAIQIDWYNLETGTVETTELPAVPLNVLPAPDQPMTLQDIPWRLVLGVIVALSVFAVVLKMLWPVFVQKLAEARERRRASEHYAYRQVLSAIRRRDLNDVYAAFDKWHVFQGSASRLDYERALAGVGALGYSAHSSSSRSEKWSELQRAYVSLRTASLRATRRREQGNQLPSLNPDYRIGTASLKNS